jgi:hypothetical protein
VRERNRELPKKEKKERSGDHKEQKEKRKRNGRYSIRNEKIWAGKFRQTAAIW